MVASCALTPWDIQACGGPIHKGKICIREDRRNRDKEEIRSVSTYDDCRPNLITGPQAEGTQAKEGEGRGDRATINRSGDVGEGVSCVKLRSCVSVA